MTPFHLRRTIRTAGFLSLALFWTMGASGGVVVRALVEPGVFAVVKNARVLSLECRPPAGAAAEPFLGKYLADPRQWQQYKDRLAVAIPFAQLKPEAQRTVLLTIFPQDVVTKEGWWHTAQFSGVEGLETVWTVCEWLTGKGTNHRKVLADPHNRLSGEALQRGERFLVPAALLLPAMKEPTPDRLAELQNPKPAAPDRPVKPPAPIEPVLPQEATSPEEPEVDLDLASRDLFYGSDDQGPYALYRIKGGEALYTAVVVRYTDFRDNTSILEASDLIRKRSGIKDVHQMKPGQKVLIPVDMLSDRFQPEGSQPRQEYEAAIQEAARLKQERITSHDLSGVLVVLDPGHGGKDYGAADTRLALYEDEIAYDMVCRVKRLIENQTRAKVYVTVEDPNQHYKPDDRRRFTHDTDERLLTTPPYRNADARVSANLRWYLANSIFRKEQANGIDPRKMVFTSVHCDALFNEKLRGAMVYIPGAKLRRESEEHSGADYDRYAEVREQPRATTSAADRRRDEALSRNFAETLLAAMGRHTPPLLRHRASDPIRSQIRQSGGRVYVPAVLRNTLIPTKILIETANMTNQEDCARLADPQWREWFAEAYVDALKAYFGS